MHYKTFALLFSVVYLSLVSVTSANPIDIDENDLPICPEGCKWNFLFFVVILDKNGSNV